MKKIVEPKNKLNEVVKHESGWFTHKERCIDLTEKYKREVESADDALLNKMVVAKWRFVADLLRMDRIVVNSGASTCAYCARYNKAGHHCNGCPVQERSGFNFCFGTPYRNYTDGGRTAQAADHFADWLEELEDDGLEEISLDNLPDKRSGAFVTIDKDGTVCSLGAVKYERGYIWNNVINVGYWGTSGRGKTIREAIKNAISDSTFPNPIYYLETPDDWIEFWEMVKGE